VEIRRGALAADVTRLRERAGVVLRVLLAVVGLAIVAYLVHDAGPSRVLRILWEAGPWLPLILVLEVAQFGSDYGAIRSIVGSQWQGIPSATRIRSAAIAYAMMVLLPAGRAAGEIARATLLSKNLGLARAAAASVQLQSAFLFANAVLSLVAWGVVQSSFGAGSALALLLAGNVLFQAFLSIGLIGILRYARFGRWLDGLRTRFLRAQVASKPLDPDVRRRLPWSAAAICALGRVAQLVQYGVILRAVGGVATVRGAFISHGIRLVGNTLGDLLPNQIGVVDGVYRAFAATLGFADAPARALSIAFVARLGQLACASACILVAAFARATDRARNVDDTAR
jgi:hypothetical protein